jgi:hypothetical protein
MGQFRWDFICHRQDPGPGGGPSCPWGPRQPDSSVRGTAWHVMGGRWSCCVLRRIWRRRRGIMLLFYCPWCESVIPYKRKRSRGGCHRPRRSLLDGAAAARCQSASARPARRRRAARPLLAAPAHSTRILPIHPGNMREIWAAPRPNRGDVRAMPMPGMPWPAASYAQRQRSLSSRPVHKN